MKTLARDVCRAEIVSRLRTVRPDSAGRWGRMSAPAMICHLSDGYRMALGLRTVADATTRMQRTLVKWLALYVPVPWPAGISTLPELDQLTAGTRPAEFAADVAELETLLAHIGTRPPDEQWPAHPILGRMSRTAWLRWAYLHADHHLRQFGA